MRFASARVHFVGIGGIGMCGLAELLHNMGAKVTGSDLSENAQVHHLRKLGVGVSLGHKSEHVQGVDVVVYSSAVKRSNPELVEARRLHVPIIPRAEALAEIMRLKRGIAVAGSHGKTTTTSLVASIFIHCKQDPTVVIGGRFDLIQSTAQLGQGDWIIAEADESDGSFHKLSPELAIITNIDNDHLDHYGSVQNLKTAFLEFALRVPFYGAVVLCGDDPYIREVFHDFPKKSIFYGFDERNEYVLKKGAQREKKFYEVFHKGEKLGEFQLQVLGEHNALNAMGAIIAGLLAGIPFAEAARAVELFRGVDRRLQEKGQIGQMRIIDDYGHHPTEIRAVISALREKYSRENLVIFFQPHRFSRTESCWEDFKTCFEGSDKVYLFDIYPAGEEPIPTVNSERLAQEIENTNAAYLGPFQKDSVEPLIREFLKNLSDPTLLVTLGAGDIWKLGEAILLSREGLSSLQGRV